MQTKNKRISFFASCLSVITALMLGSCVNENLPCPAESVEDEGKGVTIEFAMLTRNALSSRTLDTPPGNTETGFAAENYLDLDNLLFLLFDDSQTLLRVFKPDVMLSDEIADQDAGEYVKYKVRAFLNDRYFLDATEGNLTFTIVVIGNYGLLSPERFAYHVGQKLEDIFAPDKVGTFAMPVSNNWMNRWVPSIFGTPYTDALGDSYGGETPAHIPMAGMQTFTARVSSLLASTVAKPYDLSSNGTSGRWINMLRALAKIEIVDRIGAVGTGSSTNQPDRDNRSWVEKAELVGYTTRGAIFPTFSQWQTNGLETQYVTAPSIPAGASYVGKEPGDQLTIDGGAINFFADAEATTAREDGCTVFSCYLTEYNQALRPSTVYPMWIKITAHSPGSDGADAASVPYRLEVAPYIDNAPGAAMNILRNNIYRYEITGISSTLDLNLMVEDWTLNETTWDYTDNPSLTDGGYLQWSPDGLDINKTKAEVIMPNNAEITGNFTFDEPKGGEWTASFVPEGQTETEAFMFVDAEGNRVSSISGAINGSASEIRIVANYEPTDFNRRARLIFTVRTFDGRTISANVVNSAEYGNNKYFTIIQNASL